MSETEAYRSPDTEYISVPNAGSVDLITYYTQDEFLEAEGWYADDSEWTSLGSAWVPDAARYCTSWANIVGVRHNKGGSYTLFGKDPFE